MNTYERELSKYKSLNKVAKQGGVVLFGSSFAKEIPVCELKQTFNIDCDIYNRSLTDLSVFDAEELLDVCVNSLAPGKILLQIGETDLERGYKTIPEIIKEYEKIITGLKSKNKHSDIIIVSVCNNETDVYPTALNNQLETMAKKMKCRFADISMAFSNESPGVKAFSMLKCYMRDRITFYDAMNMVNI